MSEQRIGHRLAGVATLLASAGAILGMHWLGAPPLIWLSAVPVYLSYRSFLVFRRRILKERQRVQQESAVQFAVIEALATAIEAKEPMARSDLKRLQICAEALARAESLPEAEVQAIRTAALLHDVGNLAVPQEVLRKRDPLTEDERRLLRSHARVGAELLRSVPFSQPVAPLVRAHHERWDGRGYPDGLSGEAIPIGARILAVADRFTALQSDRPHRAAVSLDEALAIVRRSAGEAVDPRLAERLVEVLPSIRDRLGDPSTAAGSLAADVRQPGGCALDEISAAHREELALREIARALGSSQGVFDAMMLIWLNLQDLMPVCSCALFLWNDATSSFECRFAAGENEAALRTRTASGIDGLTGPVVAKPSFLAPAGWGTTLESAVASPLTLDDRAFGVIVAYDSKRDSYTSEHRRLLGRIARQATLIVRNALISDETQSAALTDSLTGLANRRGWELWISRELERARLDRSELAVLNLDLDRFKQVNDRFGHAAGDAVLRGVAQVLRRALLPQDFCARLSGDEFVVALTACGRARATRRGTQIQALIAGQPTELGSGVRVDVSTSIGVSVYPRDGASAAELMTVADRRMYQMKARHHDAAARLHDVGLERAATA